MYKKIYIILILFILLIYLVFSNNEHLDASICNSDKTLSNQATQNISSIFLNTNNKSFTNNMLVNNRITTQNFDADNFTGIIVAWSGTTENIPSGWGLCDGSSYTNPTNGKIIQSPDLRSLFIMGASKQNTPYLNPPSGVVGQPSLPYTRWLTPHNVYDIGGEETHILSISELPKHNHNTNLSTSKPCSTPNQIPKINVLASTAAGTSCTSSTLNDAFNSVTNINGPNNQPHNNMPPYMALAYIIKI